MANEKTQIQIDVVLVDDEKIKLSKELVSAWNAIDDALDDIKGYLKDRKEEIERQENTISTARSELSKDIPDRAKLTLTQQVLLALNTISQIESDIHSYQTEKKAEIAKFEAIVNICKTKLNLGRDIRWVDAEIVKDFKARTKTFVRTDTGEIVKTLPLNDEDTQIGME